MGVGAYIAALLTIPPVVKELAAARSARAGRRTRSSASCRRSLLAAAVARRSSRPSSASLLSRMREGAMAMATIGVLVIFFVVFDNVGRAHARGARASSAIPRDTTMWWALGFA